MADVNIRNVPDVVVERLRQQAVAEGVSLSEWMRAALADRASAPTTAELVATRDRLAELAEPRESFDRYYAARLHRRRS